MQEYEVAILYDPGFEVDLSKAEARFKKIITDNGGKVVSDDNWGKRKLAYPIAKNDHAIYVFYRIEISPVAIGKLESSLNIVTEIMRYLIVRLDPKEQAKIAAAKADKADKAAKHQAKSDEAKEEE